MKSLLRVTIGLMIIMALSLFLVSNVLAETSGLTQTTNLNLTYLINGMDLKPAQFNKILKLTKEFLKQIESTSKTISKLIASNSKKANTNDFEKITAEQYRFLNKMKQFHQDLIKTIGGEKAEQIFNLIYDAVPLYLVPEKAANEAKRLQSNPADIMTNGIMNDYRSQTKMESEKGMGNMTQMNPMNNMNIPGSMGTNDKNGMNNMNGMNGMNTNNGTGTAGDPLVNQLQTSNTMLVQMFTLLQKKNGVSKEQIQLMLQLLTNQAALIQLLSTNAAASNTTGGSGNMNMGQNNMSGNSGGMSMGMM